MKVFSFYELSPDHVLEAAESSGLSCTGRCFTLNSYENRVYEVELEGEMGSPIDRKRVLKFYRPGRWSEEQILEEHQFLIDLKEAEIPVVAPIPFSDQTTLRKNKNGLWYAIFPKVGGRAPDELDDEQLLILGRLLGRIHNCGASRKANHRPELNSKTYGTSNLAFLQKGNWIPKDLMERYSNVAEQIIGIADKQLKGALVHRIHGDCHLGNLLWGSQGAFFLDFDDMVTGPAVQDLWLVLPSRGEEGRHSLELVLEGYEMMRAFDHKTLSWMETLRALRFIHYTAWLAKRWDDPAFPIAFPHFNSNNYWLTATRDLEEQLHLILG